MDLNKNGENHGKDDYEACEKETENVLEKSNRNHLEKRHFLLIPLSDFDWQIFLAFLNPTHLTMVLMSSAMLLSMWLCVLSLKMAFLAFGLCRNDFHETFLKLEENCQNLAQTLLSSRTSLMELW